MRSLPQPRPTGVNLRSPRVLGVALLLLGARAADAQAPGTSTRAAPSPSGACAAYAPARGDTLPERERRASFARLLDACMARMHAGMADVDPEADPDRVFAAAMIPHHRGAIDMARLLLLYGRDAGLRNLALQIIAEQEVEVQRLELWLGGPIAPRGSSRTPTPPVPGSSHPVHPRKER